MTTIKVGLVDLGERLPISLRRLESEMNKHLTNFHFQLLEPVTTGRIGNPTIQNEWYDAHVLFQHLQSHRDFSKCDFLIGITHVKMTELPLNKSHERRDYFSLSDFNKLSVISLNHAVYRHNSPSKTTYQYVGYLITGELLINLAKQDLMHSATHYCLFDDCEDRSDFSKGMQKGEICIDCLSKLDKAGVGNDIVNQFKTLLRWCRRTSVCFALGRTILNPLTSLSLGTGTGWLCATLLSKQNILLVLIATTVLPIVLFIHYKFRSR